MFNLQKYELRLTPLFRPYIQVLFATHIFGDGKNKNSYDEMVVDNSKIT